MSKNLEVLVENTERAFREKTWEVLERVWLSMQGCMECILENEGGNQYRVPHMGKTKKGQILKDLVCDKKLLQKCHRILRSYKDPFSR